MNGARSSEFLPLSVLKGHRLVQADGVKTPRIGMSRGLGAIMHLEHSFYSGPWTD